MDTHVGHLRYGLYKRVQDYIHVGYAHQRAILQRAWEAHRAARPAGATSRVLELACGGGSLANTFPVDVYHGLDASAERIAAARRDHPGRAFEVCDVNSPGFNALLERSDFVFCHGLLHHIDDHDCIGLLARLAARTPKPATFVAIEPLLVPVWRNPPGYLVALLDEGRFFRTSPGYRAFFDTLPLKTERFSLFPRLPIEMEAYIVRLS